jgi:hypothetical protein
VLWPHLGAYSAACCHKRSASALSSADASPAAPACGELGALGLASGLARTSMVTLPCSVYLRARGRESEREREREREGERERADEGRATEG